MSRYPLSMPGESFGKFEKVLRIGEGRRRKRLAEQAAYITSLEPEFEALSDAELLAKTAEFKQRLSNGEDLDDIDERWNLISVGVSNDIDDAELTRIGPHGSFLAPTGPDRVATFERIAQRVAEYPNRAYLLAYCSPAVANDHEVWVTLANGEADLILGCEFDAENFGVGQGVCTADFINGYCDSGVHGCGTFLACNSCQPDGGANPDDAWNSTED